MAIFCADCGTRLASVSSDCNTCAARDKHYQTMELVAQTLQEVRDLMRARKREENDEVTCTGGSNCPCKSRS
jgi:predicted amidophosphoribosyltransferase